MTWVAIIGNAGGGKSTLCAQLGKALNLPVYPVDKLQWKPGWVAVSAEEFRQTHEGWLAQDRWIIDGWGHCKILRLVSRRLIRSFLWTTLSSFITGGGRTPLNGG